MQDEFLTVDEASTITKQNGDEYLPYCSSKHRLARLFKACKIDHIKYNGRLYIKREVYDVIIAYRREQREYRNEQLQNWLNDRNPNRDSAYPDCVPPAYADLTLEEYLIKLFANQ